MPPADPDDVDQKLRRVMGWSIYACGFLFVAWFVVVIAIGPLKTVVVEMSKTHYASIVGLPCSGLAALFVVLLFRSVAGKIQFKFFGQGFEGASGPIIMWVLCFLALVLGITQTWNLLNYPGSAQNPPAQSVDEAHK